MSIVADRSVMFRSYLITVMIKDYCVACGDDLPEDRDKEKWYEKRGNYCSTCSYTAGQLSKTNVGQDRRDTLKDVLFALGETMGRERS